MLLHLGRPRKYPEVLHGRRRDYGELVVLAEVDDPVIATERPEERDLQLRIRDPVHDPGLAFRRVHLSVPEAAVQHVDGAVVAEAVLGPRVGAALLESLGETRDLVPSAEVAAQVHLRDHRQERRLAVRGASAEKYGEDKESLFHSFIRKNQRKSMGDPKGPP